VGLSAEVWVACFGLTDRRAQGNLRNLLRTDSAPVKTGKES
jgi:hypothetical protein